MELGNISYDLAAPILPSKQRDDKLSGADAIFLQIDPNINEFYGISHNNGGAILFNDDNIMKDAVKFDDFDKYKYIDPKLDAIANYKITGFFFLFLHLFFCFTYITNIKEQTKKKEKTIESCPEQLNLTPGTIVQRINNVLYYRFTLSICSVCLFVLPVGFCSLSACFCENR